MGTFHEWCRVRAISPSRGGFERKSDKDPAIGQSWRRNWDWLIPFFNYLPEIRKVIYSTNAKDFVSFKRDLSSSCY